MNTGCNRLHDNIPAVALEIPPRATNGVRFVSTQQLTNTMMLAQWKACSRKNRARHMLIIYVDNAPAHLSKSFERLRLQNLFVKN